jgi:hypothetical protein
MATPLGVPLLAAMEMDPPTGIQSGNQTLSQRLTVAQQNARHVTASEANSILERMRNLKQHAKAASPNGDVEIDLTSPLREAAKLIERAQSPGRPGQEGSVSATTPTHLMELFVQRTQRHTAELGQPSAEYLLTKAYRLIAELEGSTSQAKLPSLGADADLPPIPLLFRKAAHLLNEHSG